MKKKETVLGLSKGYKEHPAHTVEKLIKRRNFNFGDKESLFKDYFRKESALEQSELDG